MRSTAPLTLAASLLGLLAVAPAPTVAQGYAAAGPSYRVSWLVALSDEPSQWRLGQEDRVPGFMATIGVASPTAELHVGLLHLDGLIPDYDRLVEPREQMGTETPRGRRDFWGGVAGVRFVLLDGPIAVNPFFRAGYGWLNGTVQELAWIMSTYDGHFLVGYEERTVSGPAGLYGGGGALRLSLGGGVSLELIGGLDVLVPSWTRVRESLGDTRLPYAGLGLGWAPVRDPYRRFHRPEPVERPEPSRPAREEPSEPRPAGTGAQPAPAPPARLPGRLVVEDTVQKIRLVPIEAEVQARFRVVDGAPRVELDGAPEAIVAVARELGSDVEGAPVILGPDERKNAPPAERVRLRITLERAEDAELLGLLPDVELIASRTVRFRTTDPTQAANIIRFVVRQGLTSIQP